MSFAIAPYLGRDFFPPSMPQIKLHVRSQIGTRIEETRALVRRIEPSDSAEPPAGRREAIVDNLGLPISGINLAYNNTGTVAPRDGDLLLSLREGQRPHSDECVQSCGRFCRVDFRAPRLVLARRYR